MQLHDFHVLLAERFHATCIFLNQCIAWALFVKALKYAASILCCIQIFPKFALVIASVRSLLQLILEQFGRLFCGRCLLILVFQCLFELMGVALQATIIPSL